MPDKHDALGALARSRPAALDPDQLAGSNRQRNDLLMIMNSSADEPTPIAVPTRNRRTWRIAVPVGGIAVATAIAVVAATTGGSPATPATNQATAPKHGTAGDTGPVVLMDMASSIEHQPTGSGTYWVVVTDGGSLTTADAKPHQFVTFTHDRQTDSTASRPGLSNFRSEADSTVQPWRAQDRARWQADGSPTKVPLPDSNGQPVMPIGPQSVPSSHTPSDGTFGPVGGNPVTLDYLRKLPTDAAALRTVFDGLWQHQLDLMHQASPKATVAPDVETSWIWDEMLGLIGLPVPSGVRAAAYRVIAEMSGLISLGPVTDPLGRAGVGFAFAEPNKGIVGERLEIIVDPNANTLLSEQDVLVQPTAAEAALGMTAGTVLWYDATVRAGWSDTPDSTR